MNTAVLEPATRGGTAAGQAASFEGVPIEAVRAYWDARPCNVRHSPAPVGTGQYFDEVEARKYLVEPHIPRFADFSRWADRRVLEVGCGIGTDTINFARAGARVTAVDLSSASLDLARRRAEVFGLADRIEFRQGNAEELSATVPVQEYDLVYSFGVVHHSPHPDRALREMRRYLAADGTAKIMVYNRRSWKVAAIVVTEGHGRFWDVPRLVARSSEAQSGCPVTYTYTKKSARALLHLSGFRVEHVDIEHIFPYRVRDYLEYRYVRQWQFRHMPPPLFSWLEHRFGWHLCLTASAV
jgi:ubiquinone/menaquinone biosynthesis C-methylase UbiE